MLEVPIQQLISAYSYESRVFHRLLAAYKERGIGNLHAIAGTRLITVLRDNMPHNVKPIVVSIPCSRRRKRERGFDQAELLARFVANKLHFEYVPNILVRAKQTGVQKELGQLARRAQLKNVYKVTKDHAAITRCQRQGVLLIDDVATSLATLETCATLFNQAGIIDVRAAVLAHAAIG